MSINQNSARFKGIGTAKEDSMKDGSLYVDCPPFFKMFMDYASGLPFEECPDFNMLKEMIV